MTFPRMCALAEVVRTKKNVRNWKDFSMRIKSHFEILKTLDVNFCDAGFGDSEKGTNRFIFELIIFYPREQNLLDLFQCKFSLEDISEK